MSALVHPAKLISSMALVLLEHVFTLRRVSGKTEFDLPYGCSVLPCATSMRRPDQCCALLDFNLERELAIYRRPDGDRG